MSNAQKDQVDDNDSSDAKENKTSSVIQLGFSEPIPSATEIDCVAHRSYNYNDWDGGQIGGRPSWLIPRHLPSPIMCQTCNQHMRFVCQIYAPVDFDDDDRAFHRSLYVFCCSVCSKPTTTGSVRVLRGQLPKRNPYYPSENPEDEVNWSNHQPAKESMCAVCGCRANKRCPLQGKVFCGKDHQKEYKKFIHDKQLDVEDDDLQLSKALPSLYPLSELVVEEEPAAPEGETTERDVMFEANDDDEDDSDRDLEQDDLNEMVRGTKSSNGGAVSQDATTMAFYSRIQRPNAQEQCLRYCRWPKSPESTILWLHGEHQQATDKVPPCPHCASPRKFEFQLMPQLLHFLLSGKEEDVDKEGDTKKQDMETVKNAVRQADLLIQQAPPEVVPPSLVEAKNSAIERIQKDLTATTSSNALDFGVIGVYTCTNSCGMFREENVGDEELGVYREEYAWRQPSLDA